MLEMVRRADHDDGVETHEGSHPSLKVGWLASDLLLARGGTFLVDQGKNSASVPSRFSRLD